VSACFGHDRGDHTEVVALTGDFIDWQGTGLADQGICVDEVEQFVDLGGRQVVRKQDWSETVERTGWMLLVSRSQDISKSQDPLPKIVTRYSMLFGR
jgi:hypothetical protein